MKDKKKEYYLELNEGPDTHDLYLIREKLNCVNQKYKANCNLIFDPAHFQIFQARKSVQNISFYDTWMRLKPKGLHFSFYDPNKGEGHNLPLESD